jgi:hypothetical protein
LVNISECFRANDGAEVGHLQMDMPLPVIRAFWSEFLARGNFDRSRFVRLVKQTRSETKAERQSTGEKATKTRKTNDWFESNWRAIVQFLKCRDPIPLVYGLFIPVTSYMSALNPYYPDGYGSRKVFSESISSRAVTATLRPATIEAGHLLPEFKTNKKQRRISNFDEFTARLTKELAAEYHAPDGSASKFTLERGRLFVANLLTYTPSGIYSKSPYTFEAELCRTEIPNYGESGNFVGWMYFDLPLSMVISYVTPRLGRVPDLGKMVGEYLINERWMYDENDEPQKTKTKKKKQKVDAPGSISASAAADASTERDDVDDTPLSDVRQNIASGGGAAESTASERKRKRIVVSESDDDHS